MDDVFRMFYIFHSIKYLDKLTSKIFKFKSILPAAEYCRIVLLNLKDWLINIEQCDMQMRGNKTQTHKSSCTYSISVMKC